MPSGIYLPPWLQPVDRIGPFMQGVSQGVNMARTALAAQAQAFEAQQAQQQIALRQQQEERAVATAVAGVIAQKEEQKRQQAIVDMKAQQAARQFSAQMEYEQSVQAGEDPARALMRIGPRMGVNPAAIAGRMASRQPASVTELNIGGKTVPAVVQPSGTVTFPPQSQEEKTETWRQRMREGVDYSTWKTDYNTAVRSAIKAQNDLLDFDKSEKNSMLKAAGDSTIIETRKNLEARAKETEAEVRRLRDQGVTKTGTGQRSPYPEGTKIRNKKDGKLYEVRNGEPVLIEE